MSPIVKSPDCTPLLCHCKVACTNNTLSLMFGCKVSCALTALVYGIPGSLKICLTLCSQKGLRQLWSSGDQLVPLAVEISGKIDCTDVAAV